MTTEAQQLAEWLEHDPLTYANEAAALLRRQEAALMQAREVLIDRGDMHPDDYKTLKNDTIATLNELLGEQT